MTEMQYVEDKKLIRLYLTGKEKALEELVSRHKQRVFSYIMMMVRDTKLAEDLFQDTFFKVITTLRKGTYNEEGKFLPWVLRIAHNLVIDHFRREKRMPTISGGTNDEGEEYDIFDLVAVQSQTSEDNMISKQSKKDLKNVIDKLPFEQKEVLMMRHYYDMSFKEIAERTEVSINTALGRMRYALINMRKIMEEENLGVATH